MATTALQIDFNAPTDQHAERSMRDSLEVANTKISSQALNVSEKNEIDTGTISSSRQRAGILSASTESTDAVAMDTNEIGTV